MNFSKSQLRTFALFMALPVAIIGLLSLFTPDLAAVVAHGPVQQGHLEVTCDSCHEPGIGTIRQQIQANVNFALGKRSAAVNFGYQPVTSKQCLACHDRPNERHPIYRFNEPRFYDVRRDHQVNSCLGCHREHEDARVSVSNTVCSNCHSELVLKNDPVDIQHSVLVEDGLWDSCLGCHDFHGNHAHSPQTKVNDAFDINAIQDYFGNGADPYGLPKIYKAETE